MLPVKAPDRRKRILSGETDAAVDIFFVPLKLVKAGKMKMLALSSGVRNAAASTVPTARELGMDMDFVKNSVADDLAKKDIFMKRLEQAVTKGRYALT